MHLGKDQSFFIHVQAFSFYSNHLWTISPSNKTYLSFQICNIHLKLILATLCTLYIENWEKVLFVIIK